jgi:hypothetical protein
MKLERAGDEAEELVRGPRTLSHEPRRGRCDVEHVELGQKKLRMLDELGVSGVSLSPALTASGRTEITVS